MEKPERARGVATLRARAPTREFSMPTIREYSTPADRRHRPAAPCRWRSPVSARPGPCSAGWRFWRASDRSCSEGPHWPCSWAGGCSCVAGQRPAPWLVHVPAPDHHGARLPCSGSGRRWLPWRLCGNPTLSPSCSRPCDKADAAPVHSHMSALRPSGNGDDADRRLPVLLRVHRLRHAHAPECRGLLRVLLLR